MVGVGMEEGGGRREKQVLDEEEGCRGTDWRIR